MQQFAQFLLRHPILGLITVIALTVVAIPFATQVRTEYTLEHFFPSNSPEVDRFYQFADEFGTDDRTIVVAFRAVDLFTPHRLRMIDSLTHALEAVEGITRVTSLTNVELIRGEDDAIIIEGLVDDLPTNQTEADHIYQQIMAEPLLHHKLISTDGTVTAILLETDPHQNGYAFREQVISGIQTVLSQFSTIDFHLAGIPYFRNGYVKLLQRDTFIFIPLGILLNMIILFWLFRSWQGIFLPLLTVAMGAIWTVGAMYGLEISFNALTNILPVLLLVVGIADSIHILSKYYQEVTTEPHHREQPLPVLRSTLIQPKLIVTLRQVGTATFLTSLTTAIGFGTLYTANIILVRQYALISAVGVMLTFLVSVTFLPLILSRLKPPPPKKLKIVTSGWTHDMLEWVNQRVQRHPRLIVIVMVMVVAGFGYGITQIEVNSYTYEEVGPGNPLYDDLKFIENHLSGTLPFEMVLDTGMEGGIDRAETLQRIERLQTYLEQFPEIKHSIALTDVVKEMNQALNNEDPQAYTVPEEDGLLAELLFLYEMSGGDELERLVTFDHSKARISALITDCGSARTNEIIREVRAFAGSLFPPEEQLTVTGTIPVVVRVNHFFSIDILRGLLIAFVLISIIMAILFKSPKIVLASLIPNLIPIIVIAGFMGFAGIRLRPVTAITFSIAFGIAVDDSIHFLAKFRQEIAAGRSLPEAIRQTLLTTGKAMIFTSVILFFGFGILLTSNFTGTSVFGLLTSITLFVALLADLMVLPTLILLFKPKLTV